MQVRHVRHLKSPEKSKLQFCFDLGKRHASCRVMARVHRLGFLSFALALLFSLGPCMQRSVGTSPLSRQIDFADAWKTSAHSRFCCLIYATQNGWKLPILFEEIGASWSIIWLVFGGLWKGRAKVRRFPQNQSQRTYSSFDWSRKGCGCRRIRSYFGVCLRGVE